MLGYWHNHRLGCPRSARRHHSRPTWSGREWLLNMSEGEWILWGKMCNLMDSWYFYIYIYVLFMLIQSYTMGLTSKQSPQQVRKYDSMHNKYRKSMSWEYWITSEIRFLTTGRKSVTWWRLLYGCSLKPQVPRANTGVSCWIPTNEFPGAGDQPTWYEQQLYGRTES